VGPEKKDSVASELESVQLRNVTRQTVSFQVPGRSVQALPGRTVEVPKAYLDVGEVAVLMKRGALVLLARAAEAKPARPAEAKVEDEAGAENAEAAPSDKTAKRGMK